MSYRRTVKFSEKNDSDKLSLGEIRVKLCSDDKYRDRQKEEWGYKNGGDTKMLPFDTVIMIFCLFFTNLYIRRYSVVMFLSSLVYLYYVQTIS